MGFFALDILRCAKQTQYKNSYTKALTYTRYRYISLNRSFMFKKQRNGLLELYWGPKLAKFEYSTDNLLCV